MHGLKDHAIILPVLFVISLSWAGPAFSQGNTRHTVGGFAGFTDRDDADFTIGGEYEYRLQDPWSVGAVIEYTPDVVFNEDFTTILATAHYRPATMSRLKLTAGAGIEFKDIGGDDARFRVGAGYDVFLEGPITVTPRVAIDFGDGDENIVFGVSALYDL